MGRNFDINIVKVEGESIFSVTEIYSGQNYQSIEECIDNKIEVNLGYLDPIEERKIEVIKNNARNIYLIVTENERGSQVFNIKNCQLKIVGIHSGVTLSTFINKELNEKEQAIIDYLKREYDMLVLIKKVSEQLENK